MVCGDAQMSEQRPDNRMLNSTNTSAISLSTSTFSSARLWELLKFGMLDWRRYNVYRKALILINVPDIKEAYCFTIIINTVVYQYS